MRRSAALLAAVALFAAGEGARAEDADFLGAWTAGESRIAIERDAAEPELLRATGRTCVGCGTPGERVGRFEILGRPSGALMVVVETEGGGFTAELPATEEATCVLALRLRAETLDVLDNGGCGGAGVSFDGTYGRE